MPAKGADRVLGEDQLTCSIALISGAYLLLSAIGVVSRRDTAERIIVALRDNPALTHAVGAVAFFVGAGLLTLHHRWATPTEALVSAVAAWWALEGALTLALGTALFRRPDTAVHFRRMNFVAIPVGLALVTLALLPLLETFQ